MPDLLPPSRLSLILQQLADGTFDEDKYIIGKRVDHYMTRATDNKRATKKEGTGLGSAASPTWAPETRRPAWPAHPRASPSAPAQPLTSQGPSLPAPHPPPLFSHLPRDFGPMAPLGSLKDFDYSGHGIYKSEAVRAQEKKKGKRESKRNHKVTGRATDSAKPGQRDQATSSRVTTRDQATDGAKVVTRDQGTEVSKSLKRDQATESATRSTKTLGVLTDPAVSQGTQAGGKESRLQIAPQGWVNIRNENVVEVLPGVSIIPRPHHSSRKQATHALMEYVHPNSATDESASEIDEASRRRLQMDERSPDGEPEMLQNSISVTSDRSHASDGNKPNADGGIQESAEPGTSIEDGLKMEHLTIDESRSRRQEDGESRTSYFSPRFPAQPSLPSARGEEEDAPLEERLNDTQNEAGSQHAADHPQVEYIYVFQDDAEQEVPEDRGRENEEGDECGDLPGYMPRVQWREVTTGSKMFDDEERMDRRMLQEAEQRLLEHERRHRLLNSLQERLSRLLHTGAQPHEENYITSAAPQTDVAEESLEDAQGEIQSPDAVTREYLTALVKERLQAYKLQTKDKEPEAAVPTTPPTSPSPREECAAPTEVAPPPDTPRDLLPDQPAVGKVRTPSPSPPPSEAPAPRRESTPQLSRESSDEEEVPEVIPTPPSSPPHEPAVREDLRPTPHTPALTPVSSPAKRQTAVTPSHSPETSPRRKGPEVGPVVTPADSPVHTHRSGRSARTPSQSPSPRKSPTCAVAVPDTPTPSVPSPGPRPPPDDAILPPSDTSNLQAEEFRTRVSPPRDPGARQLTPPKIDERKFSDEDIQIEYANVSVDLLSPETPSVVCNSSSDVTVASSVEAVDLTGISVSDGEILGGPTSSVSLSLEAGEVAKPDCMCLLAAAKSGTLQKGATKMQKTALCSYHESLLQRSEGEVECSETSEGLLLVGHSVGEDQTIQDSPEQSLLGDEAASEAAGSVQVSVVRDESYSSGDTQGLPRQHLEVLQRENTELLNRLRNLGSMNFLRRSFQSSSSSSSK
ncbi:titin-like [Penaeus monodon]|uniref:titin-like n=1 Tax=Penaeus monodon TaxID=6687 RepID=UPI0018A7339B|nr:titin-like [Penaeus monodon]